MPDAPHAALSARLRENARPAKRRRHDRLGRAETQLPAAGTALRADQSALLAQAQPRPRDRPRARRPHRRRRASSRGPASGIDRGRHRPRGPAATSTVPPSCPATSSRRSPARRWSATRRGSPPAPPTTSPPFARRWKPCSTSSGREAECVGYDAEPYDALLDDYEPGEDRRRRRIHVRRPPRRTFCNSSPPSSTAASAPTDVLTRHYPADRQRELSTRAARAVGFGLRRRPTRRRRPPPSAPASAPATRG